MEDLNTLPNANGAGSVARPREQAMELLRAQFFQWCELHPAAHLYALLDCNHPVSEDDPLHPEHLAARAVSRPMVLVQRADLGDATELMPRLLLVRAAGESGYVDEPLLNELLASQFNRCGSVNGSYVALWICTEQPPEELAASFGQRGMAMCLAQARQRYLPWFEPHRMALMMADPNGESQLRQWMRPALHWAWIDAAGDIHQRGQQAMPNVVRGSVPNGIWAALDRIALARLVFVAFRKAGMPIPKNPEIVVEGWLASGQAQGLVDQEDLVFFSLNCATLGPGWHRHPTAKRLIAESAKDDQLRLAARMAALSDDELNAIGEAL